MIFFRIQGSRFVDSGFWVRELDRGEIGWIGAGREGLGLGVQGLSFGGSRFRVEGLGCGNSRLRDLDLGFGGFRFGVKLEGLKVDGVRCRELA